MYKKMNKILGAVIVGVIFLMSMGYSVLNRELNISGELTYRPEGDVRITDVTLASTPENTTLLHSDFSKKQINIGFRSSEASAKIAFTIEVTNFTDTEMGILGITDLPDIAKVSGYTLKNKLVKSDGSPLKAGESTTFTITFNPTVNNTYEYILKFDFEPVCKITYNGFKDTTNFKNEVLYRDTFTQDFGSNATKNIEVTMNGVAIENYTYSNNVLTISNVTGDILIDGSNAPIFIDASGANEPVLNGDMIPVVYDEENKTWVKQAINKSYDYSKQIWANAVTVKNTIEDLSGKGHVGIINGAVVGDREANFDGKDDYIDTKLYNITKFSFAVRFNLHSKNSKNQTIIGNTDGAGFGLYIPANSNELCILLYDEETLNYKKIATTIECDTEYLAVCTFDGAHGEFYLNGKLIGEIDIKKFRTSSSRILIGAEPQGNGTPAEYSNTTIYDVLIFDTILTHEEIENNYTDKISIGNSKPMLYYDFEEKNREYYKKADIGTQISMDDINTMWVWIPRYSYTIKSEDGGSNYFGKASFGNNAPSRELPGEIDVKFIKNGTETGIAQYMSDEVSGWRTNEAFNFAGANQEGMWVGKFETTGSLKPETQACTDTSCNVNSVTIKPGLKSLSNQTVSSFFYMARSMQLHNADTYGFSASGDLHMMKNDEWGAVAYLSQSKYGKYGNAAYTRSNKEVYINNSSSFITGTSGGRPSASEYDEVYEYNDMTNLGTGKGQAGPGASTTGNIYGIYDMSGGGREYVMGVLEYDAQGVYEHNGTILADSSGFKGLYREYYYPDPKEIGTYELPDTKYYNKYKSADTTSYYFEDAKPELACNEGVCYGHALSETYGNESVSTGWYYDEAIFPDISGAWFQRGDQIYDGSDAGVFSIHTSDGNIGFPCRLTLVP